MSLALRVLGLALQHFDLVVQARHRAPIDAGTHRVERACQALGTGDQLVDRVDDIRQHLTLGGRQLLDDLQDRLTVAARLLDRIDLPSELLGGHRDQRTDPWRSAAHAGLGRIRRGGPVEHVTPGVAGLPQSPESGEHSERAPDADADDCPRDVSAIEDVEDHYPAEDRRPGHERGARSADDVRLARARHGRQLPAGATSRPPGDVRAARNGERAAGTRPAARSCRSSLARRVASASGRRRLAQRTGASGTPQRRPIRRCAARLQGASQRVCRRPAGLGLFLEAAHHARGKVLRAVGSPIGNERCLLGDVLHQDAGHRRCRKGQLAHEHLKAHHAKAVEV